MERPRRQPRRLTPGHTLRRRPAQQPPALILLSPGCLWCGGPLASLSPARNPLRSPRQALPQHPPGGFHCQPRPRRCWLWCHMGSTRPGPDATALQQQARLDSLEEAQLRAVLHVSRLEETQPTEGPHGSGQPTVSLPQPSTRPSATAGPGPDTPSQPMAPPPAAGLPV